MTFHSTIASRIQEIPSIVSMEYRATLHYIYTNCAIGVNDIVVVDKNMEAM